MVERKKTTIYTLSAETGVSPSTVSRALSNDPSISAEVRARVQALAHHYQFRPRAVVARTVNICVLIQQYPVNLYPHLPFIIEGVAEYCQQEKLEMSLFATNIEELNRADIVRELRRRNANGVILPLSSVESRFVQALDAASFPYFSILNDPPTHRPSRLLSIDNRQAASRAVRYLLELGHRKIAALSNHLVAPVAQQRLDGYIQTLTEAGIAVEEQLIQVCSPNQDGFEFGYEALKTLLKERPDVTALFAFAHDMAIGALRACHQLGIRVPQDLSLITCDDYPMTAYLFPALTAIPIPYHQLGYLAARQVHRLIRHLPELPLDPSLAQAGELIVRESTAAPRSPRVIPRIKSLRD